MIVMDLPAWVSGERGIAHRDLSKVLGNLFFLPEGCLHMAVAHISSAEFMRSFNATKARIPVHGGD